jgi:hypothetical protein
LLCADSHEEDCRVDDVVCEDDEDDDETLFSDSLSLSMKKRSDKVEW